MPTLTAVTKPELFTVAIEVEAEDQGVLAFAVADPVNCVVPPLFKDKFPLMVGNVFTVPDAATLTVVAPVELNAIFPEMFADDAAVILT